MQSMWCSVDVIWHWGRNVNENYWGWINRERNRFLVWRGKEWTPLVAETLKQDAVHCGTGNVGMY